jgi:RNA polymerase sigma-54 factor
MALGPRLDLRQSQSLVMTPQLQQAIKLLALSNLEVEAFIGEALDANPLLELGDSAPAVAEQIELPETARRTTLETSPVDQLIGEGRAETDRPLDIDPIGLDRDRETGDWGGAMSSAAGDEDYGIIDQEQGRPSLADHLHAQIGTTGSDSALIAIAGLIIDQLDEAGYLSAPLEELAAEQAVPLPQAEAALALVHQLDPTGVGARSLSECLALQAIEADRHDPAMARLIANLDLLAKGELARLKRMCGVDDEDFADMLAELRGYDPKPGLKFGAVSTGAVTPDILITPSQDGGWDVAINPATLPRVIVNRPYYLELRGSGTDKAAKAWLAEKLSDANWLIKALDQRQKTILKVAAELVKQQDGFFRYGVAHLRPLTLRGVAEVTGLHESTVSRVAANKYLSCAKGTFALKFFFSSGVASADGEGGASAEAVKAAIRQLIDSEDPKAILSDDTLVELLRGKGFELARRTVAKYREAIGLGSSVQRRRQKAISALSL